MLAEEIAATAGWREVRVSGAAPTGPRRSSPRHSSVMLGRPWVRRSWAGPVVRAIAPNGRRVTIGSRQRWDALADAHFAWHPDPQELGDVIAVLVEGQIVCSTCFGAENVDEPRRCVYDCDVTPADRCGRCGALVLLNR